MNDCKYGYFVRDDVLDFALLRLEFAGPATAAPCDMHECEDLVPATGTRFALELTPFEIKTQRIKR